MTCQPGWAKTVQTTHERFPRNPIKSYHFLFSFFTYLTVCCLTPEILYSDQHFLPLNEFEKSWNRSRFCPKSWVFCLSSYTLPMLPFSFGSQFANESKGPGISEWGRKTAITGSCEREGTFWQHCTLVILRRGVTECLKRPESRLPFSERYYSPQPNVTHKNTYSCIRQHQWKGRHHGGREKTEPEGEREWKEDEDVFTTLSVIWQQRR